MIDDDDLTPWNPVHFGHTDFQKESDGQLTIFFEDDHEPPDPDDFASIAAYEIAWADWETQQTLPQEDTIMNFNITTSFENEIEQLKAKLAELETQKHRLATCANRIVEQVGECVIEMKEAGVSDEILNNWACVIYKEITGEDVPKFPDSAALKTAREEIRQLKSANFEVTAMLKIAALRRDHYQEELQKLQSGNGETSDNLVIEGYKKTILELTKANQKITEEVLKLRGELPQDTVIELLLKLESSVEQSGTQVEQIDEDPRQNPEFLEATNNQEIVSEFLRKLDRISRVDKLDWLKIKELPLNVETMKELGLQVSPKSKTHKKLLEQMPVMCARYIEETGDNSDLDWLPGHFVESVREALAEINNDNDSVEENEEPKESQSTSLYEVKPVFQRGDTVLRLQGEIGDEGKLWTVLDVNGQWVNVRDSEGLTDMCNISDVELVADSAA